MDFLKFKNTRRGLWVGRGLVFAGAIITLCLVYFNGKHGWSLGNSWDEKIGFAILHGAVDPITAMLVSAGAIAIAWRYFVGGVLICCVAVLFTAYSMLTTAGFMSSRLAPVISQKAALAELDKQAKWWNGTTYSKELSRGDKMANRAEARSTFKEKVKVASQVTDTQAVWIASLFGVDVEKVQNALNLISSGIGQLMKYMALLVGFFLLSNRDERTAEPAVNHGSGTGSGGSGGGEPKKPTLVHPEPKPEPAKIRAEPPSKQRSVFYVPSTGAPERLSAFDRAYELAMQNPHLSTRALVKEAGKQFSQSTASRVKKRLNNKVHLTVRKHGNGRGHQALAYN